MKTMIERAVSTRGKDENIMDMVVFPYNEDEMRERFKVDDLKELYFVDRPDGKMSIPNFNHVITDADTRANKIENSINAAIVFLMEKMKEHPEWLGQSESIPLNYQDAIVWNYCMKDDYMPPDEKAKVWYYKGELTVFYGEKKK